MAGQPGWKRRAVELAETLVDFAAELEQIARDAEEAGASGDAWRFIAAELERTVDETMGERFRWRHKPLPMERAA